MNSVPVCFIYKFCTLSTFIIFPDFIAFLISISVISEFIFIADLHLIDFLICLYICSILIYVLFVFNSNY